jgi:hypothetical protein
MDEYNSSFSVTVHPIYVDIAEESVFNMRLTMAGLSGFERVAHQAVADVRKKDYLKRICESDEEFKYKWRLECRKKEEKLRAMKQGTWKSKLGNVSFETERVEINSPVSVRKGRFLITIFQTNQTEKKYQNKPISQRKGRFWVTKYFVARKQEVVSLPKPTTVKKGRFLITTHR